MKIRRGAEIASRPALTGALGRRGLRVGELRELRGETVARTGRLLRYDGRRSQELFRESGTPLPGHWYYMGRGYYELRTGEGYRLWAVYRTA